MGWERSRWCVVRGKGLLSKKKDDPRLSSTVVGGSIQRRGTSLHSIMEFNEDLIGIWSDGAFVWREIWQFWVWVLSLSREPRAGLERRKISFFFAGSPLSLNLSISLLLLWNWSDQLDLRPSLFLCSLARTSFELAFKPLFPLRILIC